MSYTPLLKMTQILFSLQSCWPTSSVLYSGSPSRLLPAREMMDSAASSASTWLLVLSWSRRWRPRPVASAAPAPATAKPLKYFSPWW